MSRKKLQVVKETTCEQSPVQQVFEEGFNEGYARGCQQATEYYSQKNRDLHAQIFALQQKLSGSDQPPRSVTLRGLIECELRKEGFLEAEIDRRISLIRSNSSQAIMIQHDISSSEPDVDDFW